MIYFARHSVSSVIYDALFIVRDYLNLTLVPVPIVMRILTLEQVARNDPARASHLNNVVRTALEITGTTL